MESTSFIEPGGTLQPLHFGFCLANKSEFILIVLKGGKRERVIGTPYRRFGKQTVIADHFVSFDTVTEFFDFACGSDNTM